MNVIMGIATRAIAKGEHLIFGVNIKPVRPAPIGHALRTLEAGETVDGADLGASLQHGLKFVANERLPIGVAVAVGADGRLVVFRAT